MRTAGKAGGSAPDAIDMPGRDRSLAAVEVAHLAGVHVRGADGESRRAALDEREVDEIAQGLFQRSGRVETGLVLPERIMRAEEGKRIGLEEARNAAEQRRPVGGRVGQLRPARQAPELLAPHPAPELLQPVEAVLRLVARDQAGIDGADRGADDPIRLDARLVQGLIDARLVGAERAPALEDENNLPRLL